MNYILQKNCLRIAAILLCVLMSWSVGLRQAESYAAIDELSGSVDQLHEAGEIFDATVKTNLITSLQTIGTLIDDGNTITAKELLTAFTEEVSSLGGVLMSTDAATKIVEEAKKIVAVL